MRECEAKGWGGKAMIEIKDQAQMPSYQTSIGKRKVSEQILYVGKS